MGKSALRKSLACILAVATIGTGYVIPIVPSVLTSGIVASAATTVLTKGDYKYCTYSTGVKFLGYADETETSSGKTVTHYPKTSTMEIPGFIDGKTVLAIGTLDNVDDYMETCTAVVIPSSVKVIDSGVFDSWENIKKVTFNGTNITSIGSNAFLNCTSLSKLSFTTTASSLSIDASAFEGCESLTEVSISSGGTLKIADSAFMNCSKVSKVTLTSKSSMTIGSECFSGCSNVSTFTANNTGKFTIGEDAFYECERLKTVKTGKGGVYIKNSAFSELDNLTTVDLCADATNDSYIGDSAFYKSGVKTVTIPKNVTYIGSEAFSECSDLATVNLADLTKLTVIKSEAFKGTRLSNIVIPSAVISIESEAFANIEVYDDVYEDELKFSTLTFKNAKNTIKISDSAFEGSYIEKVTIPVNAYNTKRNTLDISTFGNVKNIVITNKNQIVTGIGDLNVDGLTVTSPFGSYVWACYQEGHEKTKSYMTYSCNVEEIDGSNGKYSFTTVKLSKASAGADGVNVKYTTPVAKSDVKDGAGAKDVVVTVKTGVTTWKLNSLANIKKYFNYSDTIASNGLSGTFVISTKSNTGVALTEPISSTYNIQAENFDDAKLSFNTTADAKSGIYNSTYGCYVAATESSVVKPTVIVKIGDKVIDSKYYTVTYKNNKGISTNASVVVTLTAEGKKVYNVSKDFSKSFVIKMDLNKVKLAYSTFIKQGNNKVIDGDPALLTSNPDSSGFKPVVSISSTKLDVSSDNLCCLVKLGGSTTASTLKNVTNKLNLTLASADYSFVHYDDLGEGLPVGISTARIKAGKNCPYFFGEKEISYYTKYNLNSYNDVAVYESEESIINVVTVKTSTSAGYSKIDKSYVYTGKPITFKGFRFRIKDNLTVNELSQLALKTSYVKNVNVSLSDEKSNMAYVDITPAESQKFLYGTKRIFFKINAKKLADNMFGNIASVVYDCTYKKPSVTGTYNGIKLVAGTDFDVTYSNNINPGTATVTITGKGNFKDSVKKTFTINKANISECTIKWTNNTVSWRFGFDVKPVPEVYYKNVMLTRGVDYNVVYLGKHNGGLTYSGAVVKNVGEVGGIAIVPVSTSKYMSSSTYGLTNVTYGSKTVAGLVKNYTIGRIDLANVDFTYRKELVSNTYEQFKANLIPNIVVNGQILKAYTPSEVRWRIYEIKYKGRGQLYQTTRDVPLSDNIVAYYGVETTTGTGFTIMGKMVREVDTTTIKNGKTFNDYKLIEDKLYMKNTHGAMVQVCTFYYTSDFDEAHPDSIADGMGIKLDNVSYYMNGIYSNKTMVKSGVLHVYTTGSVESENRSLLTTDNTTGYEQAWDIYVNPGPVESILGNNYTIQDNKPKTLNVRFKPSTSDVFNGNVTYKVRLYNTKEDALNNTNVVKSYSIKYKNGDSTQTTKGLTLSRTSNYLYYEYTITNLDPGRQYYVNVLAVDNITNAESPVNNFPKWCLSTTSAATVNSAYYEKNANNAANYDLTVELSLPPHTVGTSKSKTSISDIFYEIIITSSSGNVLKKYRVSETGKIDNVFKEMQQLKYDSSTGTYRITFEEVPGIVETSCYYVKVKTYLYYHIGSYSSTTYKFECTKNVNGDTVGESAVEANNVTSGAIIVTSDKSVVNNSNITITAKTNKFTPNNNDCTISLCNSSGNTIWTSEAGTVKFKNGVVKYSNIPASKFVNNTDKNITYTVKVIAKKKGSTAVVIGTCPITVIPGITNISTVNRSVNVSDKLIHVNRSGSLIVTMNSANAYNKSDTGVYSLKLDYYGTDYKFKTISTSTDLLSRVQKTNGTTYEISGTAFSKIGYYMITVTLFDNSVAGKVKTFKVKVTDEATNTSIAYPISGYIGDGICVRLSCTKMTGVKYNIDVYNGKTDAVVKSYTNVTKSGTYSLGTSSALTDKTNYYVIVTATGKYNNATKVVKSDKIDLGTLEFGEFINTSTINKSDVLKDAAGLDKEDTGYDDGLIKVNVSAKYGSIEPLTYTVELERISTGNITKYSVANGVAIIDVNKEKLVAGEYVVRSIATRKINGKNVTAKQEFYVNVKTSSNWIKTLNLNDAKITDTSVLKVGVDNAFTIVTKTSGITVEVNYKRTTSTTWKALVNKSDSSNSYLFTLKPALAGTFNIEVVATDLNGKVVKLYYTIKATK